MNDDNTEPKIQIDLDEAIQACGAEAVLNLFQAQGVIRQRKEDEGKPKAELRVTGLTREQAQRIADELCRHVHWGEEWIEPKLNI
jgi:hypothetical protein